MSGVATGLASSAGGGQGSKNVLAAGTPVQLIAASTPCRWVTVTARPGNTGIIALGWSNAVRATAGAEVALLLLQAGQTASLPVTNASLPWEDASVSGDGVVFGWGV